VKNKNYIKEVVKVQRKEGGRERVKGEGRGR